MAALNKAGLIIQQIQTLKDEDDEELLSAAYQALLHLQRRSADDPHSMHSLAAAAFPHLLPSLLAHIHNQHKLNIAAHALKCLGFFIYHPLLLPFISDEMGGLVLDSLLNLVTTTPIKEMCNLGVWCISVQQLPASVIESRLDLLVGAIAYALDNPFGSLSTTFEATQASAKICNLFHVKMRAMSNIWVPPIYRRLVSTDKRERDMAERCLFKMKPIICPPDPELSKTITDDLKQKLLSTMADKSCDKKQRVPIIQAWAWYISLLGSDALHDRHLVNNMLKLPERTFADSDFQVQIASLVAWESLVDAFLPPQTVQLGRNSVQPGTVLCSTSWKTLDNQIRHLRRRIQILMIPLQSTASRNCNISVLLSCLNTWRYLLHKLDILVNHPSVMRMTFWPILVIIFSKGVDNDKALLWNSCCELFDAFVSVKVKDREADMEDNSSHLPVKKAAVVGSSVQSKVLLKDYSFNWLPWDVSDLHLNFNILGLMIKPEQIMNMNSEHRNLAITFALKIFRLLLQGIRIEANRKSDSDIIQICSKIVGNFMEEVRQTISLEKYANQLSDLSCLHLEFANSIKELEPWMLYSVH